ncbi:MAG TPA: ribose-phosphate pyrophosphokinase [Terriglobales bacterium]|nr:ribose-phosphate pyrophosphokinase [Terriglobales bacterium]
MDAATKTSVVPPAAAETGSATAVAQQKPLSQPKPVRLRQDDKWKIFSGTANDVLARAICEFLGLPLGEACIDKFSDGETYVQIEENVRGADVFMVQPTCDPVNEHLMQLLLLIDALKRASARRITVVIPYFGYARQDRKDKPRVPISSKLVADLLTTAGADRALVVDLHAPQIQGFFNIPVDHLFASPVLVDYFRKRQFPDLTVVSPDAGGVERARFFAKKMESALAIVDKRRVQMDETEVMNVIGDVHGRTCLILDDIIDTAGTLVKTSQALLDAGGRQVFACATHPVLSGPAIERISQSQLTEVVVTNTIPLTEAARQEPKIKVLSIAGLIGSAIRSIHEETSVSKLFM